MAEEIKGKTPNTPDTDPNDATKNTPVPGTEDQVAQAANMAKDLTDQAALDRAAADAAVAKAKLSNSLVTPVALATLHHEAAGRPPIRLGERRMFQPVHGPLQNPVTLQWFKDEPVKTTVDNWVLGQYYAEEPRLRLSED